MQKTYDMIASLGGNCSATIQLKHRGLRREAYPLDWVYMESDKSVRWLCGAFENGFVDFALRENMEIFPKEANSGVAKYSFRDTLTGFCFIHHFNERIDQDQAAYNRSMVAIRRRIDRFLRRIEEAESVLFILTVNFAVEPMLVVELLATLRQRYPGKTIDIHFKEFGAEFSNPLVLAEAWPAEYGFAGGERHTWAAYAYSLNITGHEWRFLDELSLTDRFRKTVHKKWYDKFIYKIWKSCGKHLNENGYGVFNVIFKA